MSDANQTAERASEPLPDDVEPKAGRRNSAEDTATILGIRQAANGIVAATYTLGVADDPQPEPVSREPQPQDVSAGAKSDAADDNGEPEPSEADVSEWVEDWFRNLEREITGDAKFNPYHDPGDGRFAHSGGSGAGMPNAASNRTSIPTGLPQDLSKMTRKQHKAVIDSLAKLPLRELRRRQDIVEKGITGGIGGSRGGKNLEIMRDHLTHAVMQREFGKSLPNETEAEPKSDTETPEDGDTVLVGAWSLDSGKYIPDYARIPAELVSEEAKREMDALAKRDMDPAVGGGVDRDKLEAADFVFPDTRNFPIVTPGDVADAVSSWGRYGGSHSFTEFQRRLTALCRRKGEPFVARLPESWKAEAKAIEFHLSMGKAFGEPGDPDTLLIDGYANTNVVDRTRDRIFPDAFRKGLDAFMRNPVVLWHHDVSKPIGKVLTAVIDETGLRVRVAIDRSLTWGREAAKMIERGMLNAFSVRAVDDLAEGWVDANGVRNITNWDLREISVVSVPAHQQALFSVAKALSDGTDLIDIAPSEAHMEAKHMAEENMAPVANTAPLDEDALIAKAIARMEAKQKADQDAAEAKARERAAWEAELRQKWEAEQRAAQAKNLPPFPVADASGSRQPAQANDQMRRLGQLIVGSKYDRLGDLDLIMRYYLQSQAHAQGKAPQPSERFYRATMARAAKFMQTEDEVPVWDPYAGARPTTRKVPAFDPSVVQPFVASEEDRADVVVDGKVVAQNVRFDENVTPKGLSQLLEIGAKSDEIMLSTGNGYGDQWVPTLMSAILWRTIRLNANVLPLFDQFDMPSQPYDYPAESTDPTFYTVAETLNESQLTIAAGAFTDSRPGTAKVTFTAGKMGAISYWSEELGEDSIVAVEPALRNQYGVSMAHAIDRVLIHGDKAGGSSSTNISYYGSTESAAAWYATLNGLRHEPFVTTTSDKRDAGALTIDDVAATRALMGTNGRFGADPSQLVIVCDVPTGYKFGNLPEVLTVDKFGPQATILSGQLAAVQGIPLVVSQDYDQTDLSGYINYTSGNTCGQFLVVNRLGWKVGWRRRPRIFVGQIPFSDAWYIMSSARLDLEPMAAGMCAASYNITI